MRVRAGHRAASWIGSPFGEFSLRRLWSYSWGTIVHPTVTFQEIAATTRLLYPTVVMLAFGVLYSALAMIAYLQGHQPSLPILIAIPAERFYLAEAIYLTPLTLQLWLLFSALCHAFAGHGRGSFDSALAVLGFSNAIPNIVAFWLPDFVSSIVFGRILTIPMAIYGTVWLVWLVWLSAMGLKVTHRLPTWKGVVVAASAFAVHLTIGVFFIR